MTLVLALLVVLWLIAVWLIVIGLLAFAATWFVILMWRIVWAVAGFLVRLLIALIFGPERSVP